VDFLESAKNHGLLIALLSLTLGALFFALNRLGRGGKAAGYSAAALSALFLLAALLYLGQVFSWLIPAVIPLSAGAAFATWVLLRRWNGRVRVFPIDGESLEFVKAQLARLGTVGGDIFSTYLLEKSDGADVVTTALNEALKLEPTRRMLVR
jgi:hypothetical protein